MLILASKSPRRKEILSYFSIPFKCISSNFDEKTIKFLDDPKSYALQLAEEKALSLEGHFNDIILSYDTIVYHNNKVYTKPRSANEAFQMLNELSNSWHSVFTSVCVKFKNEIYKEIEETKILFHALSEKQMNRYHQIFYFSDKAGGYAIQKSGSIIIKRMEGCYYNVMGLPLNTTKNLLLKVGINLWDFLKPC